MPHRETGLPSNAERRNASRIVIRRVSDAPLAVRENPFYDSEIWGRAKSPEEIYLPDSDEAISFAIAAHEIGHLVEAGARNDATLDNFEATRAEEVRAWTAGWPYLERYLGEYYQGDPSSLELIRDAFTKIRDLMMRATDLSKPMYVEQGALAGVSDDEEERLLIERRQKFSMEHGTEMRGIFDEIKATKIGRQPDWERFTTIVTKAVTDILKDNVYV